MINARAELDGERILSRSCVRNVPPASELKSTDEITIYISEITIIKTTIANLRTASVLQPDAAVIVGGGTNVTLQNLNIHGTGGNAVAMTN